MPRVTLTSHLHRFTGGTDAEVDGTTVGAVLDAYFTAQPAVRPYVVDERGAIRKHVVVFVNGEQLLDRTGLGQPVAADDTVHILQALSGGCTAPTEEAP